MSGVALVSVNVMVPGDLVAAIDRIAETNRVNRSVVVRSLILRALRPAAPDDAILALDAGSPVPVIPGSPR